LEEKCHVEYLELRERTKREDGEKCIMKRFVIKTTLMMVSVSTSEMPVKFHQATRRNIPEEPSVFSPPYEPKNSPCFIITPKLILLL
jgi:hypothetical protein